MTNTIEEKRVVTKSSIPETDLVSEEIVTSTDTNPTSTYEFGISKISDVVWAITGLIILLILLRFVFLLLGANNTGIVAFLYNLSGVFVLPFSGIFESVRYGESFFDTASIVAIVMYAIIAVIITTLVRLFSTKTNS